MKTNIFAVLSDPVTRTFGFAPLCGMAN